MTPTHPTSFAIHSKELTFSSIHHGHSQKKEGIPISLLMLYIAGPTVVFLGSIALVARYCHKLHEAKCNKVAAETNVVMPASN